MISLAINWFPLLNSNNLKVTTNKRSDYTRFSHCLKEYNTIEFIDFRHTWDVAFIVLKILIVVSVKQTITANKIINCVKLVTSHDPIWRIEWWMVGFPLVTVYSSQEWPHQECGLPAIKAVHRTGTPPVTRLTVKYGGFECTLSLFENEKDYSYSKGSWTQTYPYFSHKFTIFRLYLVHCIHLLIR